ncbi:hypothetical protein [Novosphingobium sp. 9U]|uniref:hypothetical protein n=1 Tax=Novosphingobium sp. 9U TaxID=2653158 RepID=UPI00135AB6CA|nr:hypothetical protein [Novosphingobium sp. 9U]
MKIKLMIAAGLLAVMGTTATAQAQDHRRDRDRYEHRDEYRGDRGGRRYDNDNRRDHRDWNRGGRRYEQSRWDRRHRTRCHTEWRHHRRIRVCR